MDPLQWMGAVRMRVQKADKNITIFHTIPVIGYHCYYHEAKSCLCVINKFNIKMFLTSNQWFQLMSRLYVILLSPVKMSSHLKKYAWIKLHFQAKTVQNSYNQISYSHILSRNDHLFGLLWCFNELFGLAFWRHPFTADDLLVSKWCNAKFLQICSSEETNS